MKMGAKAKVNDYEKIHLQWFGEEGEGDEGEGGDTKSGLFNPHNVLDDDDFEVVTSNSGIDPATDPYAEKTKEDLVEELRRREENEKLLRAQADTNAALLEGLRDLKPSVNPQHIPPPAQPQAPVEKPLTKEELQQLFIDDPVEATNRLLADNMRKLDPILMKTVNSAKETSRRFAYTDPDSKAMLDRYGPEIEAQVNSVPLQDQIGNIDLYQNAIQMVKMKHFKEIESDSVAAAIKAKDEEIAKLKADLARGSSRGSFNEGFPRPAPGKRAIYMTKDERAKAEREAAMMGMDFKDYMRSKELERSEG